MKKIFYCFLLLQFIFFTAYCQQSSKASFAVETDPIAFILNGYSFHGVYQPAQQWSIDAGVFGIDEPSFYSDNDKFNIHHKGAGLKVHYHFTENTKGFYIGANSCYGMTYATEKKSGEKQQGAAVEAGIHTGYRLQGFSL
jgi:Protein of unknown function (DUF3575)